MLVKKEIPLLLVGLAAFVTFLAPVVSNRRRPTEETKDEKNHRRRDPSKNDGKTWTDGQARVVAMTFLAFMFLLLMYPW
jgi:hypothetical protein